MLCHIAHELSCWRILIPVPSECFSRTYHNVNLHNERRLRWLRHNNFKWTPQKKSFWVPAPRIFNAPPPPPHTHTHEIEKKSPIKLTPPHTHLGPNFWINKGEVSFTNLNTQKMKNVTENNDQHAKKFLTRYPPRPSTNEKKSYGTPHSEKKKNWLVLKNVHCWF